MRSVRAWKHAPRTAEATWDENGATPSRGAPAATLHAHREGVADTPRHPSADPDVSRLRVTA